MALWKLTALKVDKAKRTGTYGDGGGLYLQVRETDAGHVAKSWIFRFRLRQRLSRNGKASSRQMGLGPFPDVTLDQAREKAMECRKLARAGVDPIEARRRERAQAAANAAQLVTFKECGKAYIAAHRSGWRNIKHAAQWEATLATYAYPLLGALPVQAIETGVVLKVLEPIWNAKPETASRVRGRIEAALDYAIARKWRGGENPARWRGHLEQLLPARAKVRAVRHHAALPYAELGGFVVSLRLQDGIAARAFEFAILTAVRTGEAIGARWGEVDFDAATWTLPAVRMKAAKDHRVPLSARAIELLAEMRKRFPGTPPGEACVFPGAIEGKPLSNMAFLMLLRRMGRDDLTAHGFRSTFRDWAAERTNFPRDVAEMALAHAVGDKVEAAYRRGDLFQKRRQLMTAWAAFCAAPPTSASSVTSMRKSGAS